MAISPARRCGFIICAWICRIRTAAAETAEAFCDGHVASFDFFGGAPQSVLYDNTRLAVARIVKGGKRLRSQMFAELQSHYLFEDKFGRPGKGNDKGKVEGLVGFVRRNFMTPLPVADSFDALNARFVDACMKRRQAVLRGHTETIDRRVAPQVLLGNPLKALKLPTFAREREKVAMESAQDRADYPRYLLRLCELERIDRERRTIERRIRLARFPQVKSLDTFDFEAQPSLNKPLVLELARCEWIEKRHNCIALGPSGTGKTHVALALGLAACQKGHSVAFTTAAALVHELMEARNEHRLRALQKHLNTVKLLIVDELGYVPFTAVGSELLFELFSQRYERGATLVTSNLPFDEWTSVFGSERLTGALLDRLTHHVHILEMNGESFRFATSKKAQREQGQRTNTIAKTTAEGGALVCFSFAVSIEACAA
jgi:DNA replication protein DnaC